MVCNYESCLYALHCLRASLKAAALCPVEELHCRQVPLRCVWSLRHMKPAIAVQVPPPGVRKVVLATNIAGEIQGLSGLLATLRQQMHSKPLCACKPTN